MARSRAALPFILRWISRTSPIWRPTSQTGLSDDVGCWKIIEIAVAADVCASRSLEQLEQVLAVEEDLAGLDPRRAARPGA